MPARDTGDLRTAIGVFVGAGGTALSVSLAAWSYTAAETGDMIFAALLVVMAWLVASAALVVTNQYGYLKFADSFQTKGQILSLVFILCFLLYGWEWNRRPTPPVSAKEIAEQVIASLPPLPAETRSQIFDKQLYAGRLYNGTTEANIRYFNVDVKRKFEIGNSGTIFLFDGPQGAPIFKIFNKSTLIIETIGGRVTVSTKIFDERGQLVAEIIKNEWQAAHPPISWDRNYSKDSFEVKNSSGDIVLQVRVLADRIQLQGKWYDEAGNGFGLISRGFNQGATIVVKRPLFNPLKEEKIVPLFLYPSEIHLGQKAELQN